MKLYLTAFLVVLITAFHTDQVLASCAPPVGSAENANRADIVVAGTVTEITSSYAHFFVDTYYKGQGLDTLKVSGRASPNSVTSVDFDLEKGASYLLYLQGNPKDVLQTNACSGSRKLNGDLSQEEKTALGQGATPSVRATSESKLNYPPFYILAAGTLTGLLIYLLRLRKII